MFKQLVIQILALGNYTQAAAGDKLGYKTPSAFQSAIQNKDIKLTTLASICKLCNFQIIITNNNGISININEYIDNNAK